MKIIERIIELMKEKYDGIIPPYGNYEMKLSIYEDLIEILEEVLDG